MKHGRWPDGCASCWETKDHHHYVTICIRGGYHLFRFGICDKRTLRTTWCKFLAEATALGVSWSLEHPSEPNLVQAASIWRLPEVEWLLSLRGVQKHNVLQGLFSGIAAKPTHFVTFDLPSQKFFLSHWQGCVATRKWWQTLVGRDESGQYRTARAKAYPLILNAALMEPYFMKVIAMSSVVWQEPKPDFAPLRAVLSTLRTAADNSSGQFGPDYVPD